MIADQSLISLKLSNLELGHYFLSRLVLTTMMILPSSLSAIYLPKASEIYGTSENHKSLILFFWNSLVMNFLILGLTGCFLYMAIEPLVSRFLPLYSDGIEAAKISVLTGISFVSIGPGVILSVIRKNWFYIFILFFGLMAIWLSSIFIKINDIEDVAVIRCLVSHVVNVVMLVIIYRFISRD